MLFSSKERAYVSDRSPEEIRDELERMFNAGLFEATGNISGEFRSNASFRIYPKLSFIYTQGGGPTTCLIGNVQQIGTITLVHLRPRTSVKLQVLSVVFMVVAVISLFLAHPKENDTLSPLLFKLLMFAGFASVPLILNSIVHVERNALERRFTARLKLRTFENGYDDQ